jgi:hypothetical protein
MDILVGCFAAFLMMIGVGILIGAFATGNIAIGIGIVLAIGVALWLNDEEDDDEPA